MAVGPSGAVSTARVLQSVPSTRALLDRAAQGTRWSMIAMLIGVPLGLLTNIILGHAGPEALGWYSLTLLLAQLAQTFFLFGGANVIVNFIPRATAEAKGALLLSYGAITLGFAAIFFALAFAFPQGLRMLLLDRVAVNGATYAFLALFIPIVIAQTLVLAILQGEMQLGVAARTQYGVQVASCALALVAAVVIIPRHLAPLPVVVAGIVAGAYGVTLVIGLRTVWLIVRTEWRFAWRWQLPPRFWRFTLTFHLNTIVWFIFGNVDQLYILVAFHAVSAVGVFRVASVVTTYALWAPNLLTGAMYPLFVNLVASGDRVALVAAYRRYAALTAIIVAGVGLILGLFAPEIITLFGAHAYASSGVPLTVIFALMYVALASCAYVPSTALITAHEDIWLNLAINGAALLARYLLLTPLGVTYGLIGVGIADALSLAVLYVGTLIALRLRYGVSVPARQHLISVIGAALLWMTYGWHATAPVLFWGERLLALAIFGALILRLRLVAPEDIRALLSRFNRRSGRATRDPIAENVAA